MSQTKPKTCYRKLELMPAAVEQKDMNAKFKFPRGGAKRLSKLMAERMKQKGWNLKELAQRSDNLNKTYASTFNVERKAGISVKTLLKLSVGLGMDPMQLANHVFHNEAAMPLAPVKSEEQDVEVLSPQEVRDGLTTDGVMVSINGVQMLAQQTHREAVPAIVEHAGWRMTLIPT